ncbi:MAG: hypothetical protein NUV80_00860 [Candidatus Berkelbacteria bacterium]|nr:hypothetical protein [Candidatus Berkelbacteria bacterium]
MTEILEQKKEGTWGVSQVWNESLLEREERPVAPRDRIWASELGKSKVDIYLKLKGEKQTNPPNARSLRKFEAGNIWEWIVKIILQRAGILQDAQRWTGYQYPGLLQVSGKLDFVAGGKPDYERAMKEVEAIGLPEIFTRAGKRIIKYLQEKYLDGLDTRIIEVKSVSSFMFEAMEKTGKSSQNHRLQLFHYLKAENMERGLIVYVCKDDCRMMEFPVFNPSLVEDEYKAEIEAITGYYQRNEMPPLEKAIVYDKDIEKFSKNWHVAYSGYLTKLYGLKDQMEFDEKYAPIAEKWNRVLARIREGKEMTENNKGVIAEIEKAGFNITELTAK